MVRRRLNAAVPLAAAALCLVFLLLQMLPVSRFPAQELGNAASSSQETKQTNLGQAKFLDVFVCTDEQDLRPVVVVINSTLSNARHQDRIRFHIVTPEVRQSDWLFKLRAVFPLSNIEMVSENFDFEDLKKRIFFRKDSKAREALTSPYNFVPFYIPRMFTALERFVYLDSDVVVKGDIEELFELDLGDYAVAAVEDCSQRFEMYFNFDLLESIRVSNLGSFSWLPTKPYDPKACVFNRGVMVIDTRKWIQQNLTEAIEWWMDEFHRADRALYKYGVSQPPFLLAVYESYKKLETTWNTRGLGRNEFSELERDYMEKLYSKRPSRRPFLSPQADSSKLLHFNGKFKPWKRGSRLLNPGERPASLCGSKRVDCAQFWWHYISPLAESMVLDS